MTNVICRLAFQSDSNYSGISYKIVVQFEIYARNLDIEFNNNTTILDVRGTRPGDWNNNFAICASTKDLMISMRFGYDRANIV